MLDPQPYVRGLIMCSLKIVNWTIWALGKSCTFSINQSINQLIQKGLVNCRLMNKSSLAVRILHS